MNEFSRENLLPVEISNESPMDYLMNIDKIYHWDDMIYIIAGALFIILSVFIGGINESTICEKVITKDTYNYKRYGYLSLNFNISDLSGLNRIIRLIIRFNRTRVIEPISTTINVSTRFWFSRSNSTITKRTYIKNINVFSRIGHHESNENMISEHHILNFESLSAQIKIYGDVSRFMNGEIVIQYGNAYFSMFSIYCTISYSLLLISGLIVFSNSYQALELKERRHEQELSIVMSIMTIIYNNPVQIIQFIRPSFVFLILNDVVSSFYISMIVVLILTLVGLLGAKEDPKPSFWRLRIAFGGVVAVFFVIKLSMKSCEHIGLITHQPHIYFSFISSSLISIFLFWLIKLIHESSDRIEESDSFKLLIYLPITIILVGSLYLFNISVTKSNSTIFYILKMAVFNGTSLLMLYIHYPFKINENLVFEKPKETYVDNGIFEEIPESTNQ